MPPLLLRTLFEELRPDSASLHYGALAAAGAGAPASRLAKAADAALGIKATVQVWWGGRRSGWWKGGLHLGGGLLLAVPELTQGFVVSLLLVAVQGSGRVTLGGGASQLLALSSPLLLLLDWSLQPAGVVPTTTHLWLWHCQAPPGRPCTAYASVSHHLLPPPAPQHCAG